MSDPEDNDEILELTTDMTHPYPSDIDPGTDDRDSKGVMIVSPVSLRDEPSPSGIGDTSSDDILEMEQSAADPDDSDSHDADPEAGTSPAVTSEEEAPSQFDPDQDVPFARLSAVPSVPHEHDTMKGVAVLPSADTADSAPADEDEDLSDELFELDDNHMVEEGVPPPRIGDAPVPHAFDFGTPEMVFDQAPAAPPPPPAEADHDDIPVQISFIPGLPTEAVKATSDEPPELGDDDLEESEEELDIQEAEEVAVAEAPRPVDSFFKNDMTAAEQAASAGFTSGATRRRRGSPQEWWASIFDDEYLMLLPTQSVYEQQKQMDFIQQNIGLPQGTLLLDLACGNGLNSIGMAKRNYRIVGVDLSLSMLARAGEAAQESGQKINFIHGDMRDLGFDKTFDGVFCLDTSFGFFDEPTNANVLNSVYKALKPGGIFLLELANRDFVVRQQPNLIWFQMDNMVCMEETDFNYINSRLYITRQLIIGDNQRQTRHEFSIRLYALHEIGQMLHAAGFAVTKVSGHRASPGAFFGPESSKMIIVAERR